MPSTTLQSDGQLRYTDDHGRSINIGPEHPEYQRYRAEYNRSAAAGVNPLRARLLGALFVVLGVVACWYGWHTVMTDGQFSIKLSVFAPLAFFGGILMLIFPEASGPVRPDTPKQHKVALFATMAMALAAGALNFYLMSNYRP